MYILKIRRNLCDISGSNVDFLTWLYFNASFNGEVKLFSQFSIVWWTCSVWNHSIRNSHSSVSFTNGFAEKCFVHIWPLYLCDWGFLGGSDSKRICLQCKETESQSLGGEDVQEKGMATHSSIPAWRIPWTEEPWRRKELDMTERLKLSLSLMWLELELH